MRSFILELTVTYTHTQPTHAITVMIKQSPKTLITKDA